MEIIATTILVTSLIGIGIILVSKIPVLIKLPKVDSDGFFEIFLKNLKDRVGNHPFKSSSFEAFLQKPLSRLRVLTLKIENKISGLLQELREKSKTKKKREDDNYWKEVGESVNDKTDH